MGAKEFTELCKKKVAEYYKWDNPKDSDIYVVWLNNTIQNNKAMLSTTKPDGMYFEITYNGGKQELYFDAYKRINHYEDKVIDDYSSSLYKLCKRIKDKYHNVTLYYEPTDNKPAVLSIYEPVYHSEYDLYNFEKQKYCEEGLVRFLDIYGGKAYDDLNESICDLRWHTINE